MVTMNTLFGSMLLILVTVYDRQQLRTQSPLPVTAVGGMLIILVTVYDFQQLITQPL